MRFRYRMLTALFVAVSAWMPTVEAEIQTMPSDFVYLRSVDPSILQEMRYAGYHNFLGRPIAGYHATECILTRKAAFALKKVQTELKQSGLSLKVYDCFRPQTAVNDFTASGKDLSDQRMKTEFYPRVSKDAFFKLGYVAEKSGHSRGSTVDLTIVPVPTPKQEAYHRNQKLYDCAAPYGKRFHDNSIDMGTGFDCFDERAHSDSTAINSIAYHNRSVLRVAMEQQGFKQYINEWWHFTLNNEPYPDTYFDFPIFFAESNSKWCSVA
ncbi:MAG: M15 family metallopeptidase [Gammaproteobacteria bacterium]|nr:M15 family metallopeptidase [Gammaproteobacteria bacterium]